MADTRTLPNAVHFSEFQNDPVTGRHYTGACGPTALAAAMVCATPPIETTQQAIELMTGMVREMAAQGIADANGVTTTKGLHQEAINRHFDISSPYIEWQDPIPELTLHPLLLQWAGIKPVVLMITNGQALIAVDGSRAEVGLHGHFICVVGIEPRGYVCMDGDNNQIVNALPVYPWSAILQAHPTGYLMLEMQTVEGNTIKDLQAQLLDAQTKLAAANASLSGAQNQLAQSQALAARLQAELTAAGSSGALEAIAAIKALQLAFQQVK